MPGSNWRILMLAGAFGIAALLSEYAVAAQPSLSAGVDAGKPVLLEADSMEYDQASGIVLATGHVAVTQGDSVLIADNLSYNRATDEVVASGHVSLLEASGYVVFAEKMKLKSQLQTGVVEHFKGRLNDGSLMVANYAEKISGNVTKLFRAAYTPCHILCRENGEPRAPLWSIEANEATYNQDAHEAIYHDAYAKIMGVPVLYTPYFSHNTPGAENESGFLMPRYKYSTNLGSSYYVPYYYVLGQNKDITLTPIWTGLEGLVLQGNYRQQFNQGTLRVDGSITRPQDRDAAGIPTSGDQTRGYIDTEGKFRLSDRWDWGFNIKRASDDTYLRRYFNDVTPVLNSRLYAQGMGFALNERSFASAQALSFQGLRAGDNQQKIPVILPLFDLSLQSNAADNGSRFTFDGSAMSLTRDDGAGSRRLAMLGRWQLPYLTENGQLIELGAQLRADAYSVANVALDNGRQFDGTNGRLVPEVNALWRYPFIKRIGQQSAWVVEPTMALALSPSGGNPSKIPNEDSQIPEFTDTNLFSFNRFSGWDRIESGPRITYGLRSQLQLAADKRIDFLAGQEYRVNNDRIFPLSNDLNSHFSDYVGKLGFTVNPFELSYRFRLDRETLSPKRQEITGIMSYGKLSGSVAYLQLRNDPILATQKEVSGALAYQLTKEWSFNTYAREDLFLKELTNVGAGFIFKNECVGITTVLAKTYTRDRDVKPETSINVQLSLQNLGSF